MNKQKILLPYNFTQQDKKALDFVISNYSRRPEYSVSLFHAYKPVPEIDVRQNPIMEKMSQNLTYLRQKTSEEEKLLDEAVDILVQNGFSKDRVLKVFIPKKKDIATEIIDLYHHHHYDIIILTRTPAKISRFFTGSTYSRVVNALKDVNIILVH
jgi:nucleotide-binding universal stress UspA family protein